MKKRIVGLLITSTMIIAFTSCGGKKTPEKTKTVSIKTFGIEMDIPESWSISKESETSVEISRGGKGDKRLFYVEPAEGIDGATVTFDMLKSTVKKKDGFKHTEDVKLKNGVGIKYEDKPGKSTNKNYWFIITAKGKTYSVENGIYNDDAKYYDLEKAAIESIR